MDHTVNVCMFRYVLGAEPMLGGEVAITRPVLADQRALVFELARVVCVECHPQSSDLQQLAEDVANELRGAATSKGLEYIVELHQVLQSEVWIDPDRFKQLLRNLLSNAIKFTDTGSVVCKLRAIGCGEGLVKVRLVVEDTGIGISESDQIRIFEPFIQIQAAGRYRQSGTGLGLALCRQLVAQMKGEILLTSQLGKGTCFQVDFEVPQSLKL